MDQTKHVIHTNFGNLNGNAEIDSLPEMELISTNIYAVKDIPFSRRTWRSVQVQAFEFADAWRKPYYADTLIESFPGNYAFPAEAVNRGLFTVQENGRLDRPDLLQARLGERQSWRASAKSFQVRYPIDGRFIVYVPELAEAQSPCRG